MMIILLLCVGFSLAQVNFSTQWGKRTLEQVNDDRNKCDGNIASVVIIYKIIQVRIWLIVVKYRIEFLKREC